MPTIFEHQETYLCLLDRLSALDEAIGDADGEVTDDQAEALDKIAELMADLSDNIEEKIDGYVAVIKELTARADARKGEADRIRHRAMVDEHNAARLKEILCDAMATIGRTTVETSRFRVSVAGNGGAQPIEVTDEDLLFADERFVCVRKVVDMRAVRDAIAGGETVGGVVLKERGKHLSIR